MLKDLLAPNLRIVFCGINPGLKSAMDGHHFSGYNNRFWKVLHLAGFTPQEIPAIADHRILEFGFGLTTAVAKPTKRADELSRLEISSSREAFENKMAMYTPEIIAFLGKAAYLAFFCKKQVQWGAQSEQIGDAAVWVLPNPSGLNRGFMLQDLVRAYGALSAVL